MIDTIYVEDEAYGYPLTDRILRRFPRARVIACERHGALFNRAGQNFRLQKNRPSLILAVKHGKTVLPAPEAYGLGAEHNYYFSHMLNCLYDCRYCFLQGIYRSANYVLFVNYDNFAESIREKVAQHADESVWFFSGYDCDSLALEPVTSFADSFLPLFQSLPNAWLEFRTKSTQTRVFRDRTPSPNVVIAFSFTTESAGSALEHRVPSLNRRIEAMSTLQALGWNVGLRFDPLIYEAGFDQEFAALCERIFKRIDAARVHSACIGAFRLPRDFYKRMRRLYPRERLFAQGLEDRNGVVSYRSEVETGMLDTARQILSGHVRDQIIFHMQEGR